MIKNIILGIKEYSGAFALISKLKLWRYFVIPILISVPTAIFIGIEVYALSDNIGGFIAKIWIWDVSNVCWGSQPKHASQPASKNLSYTTPSTTISS